MSRPFTSTRAMTAGLVGTGAVASAMAGARATGLTDLKFAEMIGTSLGHDRRWTYPVGWAIFIANGAALPLGYRMLLRLTRTDAGAGSGALLGLLHGLVAVGGAVTLAPYHPRPRRAHLTAANRDRPSTASLAVLLGVHVLYGAVLGTIARGRR